MLVLNTTSTNGFIAAIHKTVKITTVVFCLFFHRHGMAQKWVQLPDFPGSKRDDGVAVYVNNTCFFGTGLQEGWSATIDFYALDLTQLYWYAIPDMPHTTERQYACAFAGPNCFFVFGGTGIGGALNNLYKYDLVNKNWTLMAPKPGKGLSGASCLQFGDSVFVFGGRSNAPQQFNNEVWLYQISKNTWTKKTDLPFGGRWRGSAAVLHHKGYYLFGLDSLDRYRNELLLYQPNNDTWLKIGSFGGTAARSYAAMISASEQLVVFGGKDSLNTYYNDTWYYNDQTQNWLQDVRLPSFGRKGGMYTSDGKQLFYSCGVNQADQRLNDSWMTDIPLKVRLFEKSNRQISVAPNPCQTQITLNLPEYQNNNWFYSILNTNGYEAVAATKIENKSETVDFTKLAPGLYFLKIQDGQGVIAVQKVVKTE